MADALHIIRENIEKHTRGEDARTLDLGNCGLAEVPEEIGNLIWLEELYFGIESFNDGGVKEWKTQNSGEFNNISSLPASISRLKNLKKLQICGHENQKFDLSDLSIISELTDLQELSLWDTMVSDLSPLSGLLNLQEINLDSTQVNDLSPLSTLLNLQEITCDSTHVANLSPISKLANLKKISCAKTQVADLSPLAALTNLQEINCYSTQIADLSPLAVLTRLQKLYCGSNKVFDLSPLAALTNLQQLYCDSTQVSDLSPLAMLTSLQQLYCDSTQVSDLSPLAMLTNLQQLYCYSTQVSDLSPLTTLTNLQQLHCYSTQVSDLTPLAALTNLQEINCHSTQIADLSPLVALTNLQKIYFGSTKVSDLSPLSALINLQQLYCDHTQVSDLSPLAALTNLQELYCGSTKVSDLSPLVALINLQQLYCYSTQVSDLAPLTLLTNLQQLHCGSTQVSDLAPLAALTNLQQLYCYTTKVSDLSPLAALTNLQQLYCSETQVSDLSPLAALTNLQQLDYASTQVSDLSPLTALTNLQQLYFSETQVSDLFPLATLINLQQLDCASTQVSDLSPLVVLTNLQQLYCYSTQVFDLSPLAALTNLQQLYCSETQVSDLSPLTALTNLQLLSCYSTEVSNLSPLAALTNLQQLYCSSTEVSNLSPLAALTNLQQLDCSSTQVSDLSPLAALTNLQELSCYSTEVFDLSPLAALTNLRQLDCDATQLIDLSPLAALTNLQQLYCSEMQVSDLSPFATLTNLQQLYCYSTQVADLSPILFLIKKGIEVKWQDFSEHLNEDPNTWQQRPAILVKNCPLIHPPVETVKQGNEAILRYFADLETQGEEIVYEAKMLILGDAGAGKTSLARKIENPDALMPDEEKDSTPGIAVRALSLTERQPDFTMHLWDFGGQEVYHATHQFFLSKRSLYILLADGRKEEQLDYWLQMQEIYGQDSRLLLVVNQKGAMQPNLPMSDIRRDYPNVQEAQPTVINLKTDREGAVSLRQRIEHQIRNLPQFERGLRTPKKWAAIRRRLDSLEADHIELKAYRQICDEEGVTDPARKKDLLDFLHHLGAVLHFQDVAGLNKMVILRPEWATNAVYRLLDHTKKKGDNGHFSKGDLDAVWQCTAYEDYFAELLGLMEKFELCYPAPEEKTLFIVPSLLSDDRPSESEWPVDAGHMQLWYEYSFMPKGIVTRLIVRQHQLLESPPTVWKRGAIFAIENARAEVTESFREKRISIRASGKQAKALLTILAREIDALNSGFHFNERMTLKQIVPCHCARCKTAARPHPFDYKTLANRLERGRLTIDCEVSLDEISIPDLLRETFSDAEKILKTFERRSEMGHFGRKSHAATQSHRPTPAQPAPLKIFISYSKHDRENFLIPMTRYLSPLMRGGLIETWNDHDILAGEEWDDAIKSEIEQANVIFLLVSAHSLNTDYIWNVEIEAAMRRHEAGTARVIPIILSPCLWEEKDREDNYIFPPAKLNALPAKGKPISKWEDKDDAWKAVAEGIKAILKRK